jgi:Right handed beta helix region
MRKFAIVLAAMAMLFSVFTAAPACAQDDHSHAWVSNSGSDVSTCGAPSAPCRTITQAVSGVTVTEISCLNSADYGQFTITTSMVIDCNGSVATIVENENATNCGPGITINAPGGIVTLRNLDVTESPFNCETIGILIQAAAKVHIENCTISGFKQYGIQDARTTIGAELVVRNTVVENTGGSSSGLNGGIYIVPGSDVTATVDHSQISSNYFGIVGDGRSGGTIRATISDSVVSSNTENGITVLSSGSSVVFMIDQTKVSGNLAGLFAGGSNAGILARNTTVYGNNVGLDTANGGTLFTYGNNSVNGNATNGAFTGTASLQ